MIKSIQKILLFDRVLTVILCCVITVASFSVVVFLYSRETEKQNAAARSQVTELRSMTAGLMTIKNAVISKEKKIGLLKAGGIVPVLEQTLNSVGLKAKTLRPGEKTRVNEYLEEDAEVEIDNADLNSIVNLIYKIENSPMPFKIKSSLMRTTFEDPNKFILKMTVSLLSKA